MYRVDVNSDSSDNMVYIISMTDYFLRSFSNLKRDLDSYLLYTDGVEGNDRYLSLKIKRNVKKILFDDFINSESIIILSKDDFNFNELCDFIVNIKFNINRYNVDLRNVIKDIFGYNDDYNLKLDLEDYYKKLIDDFIKNMEVK